LRPARPEAVGSRDTKRRDVRERLTLTDLAYGNCLAIAIVIDRNPGDGVRRKDHGSSIEFDLVRRRVADGALFDKKVTHVRQTGPDIDRSDAVRANRQNR